VFGRPLAITIFSFPVVVWPPDLAIWIIYMLCNIKSNLRCAGGIVADVGQPEVLAGAGLVAIVDVEAVLIVADGVQARCDAVIAVAGGSW